MDHLRELAVKISPVRVDASLVKSGTRGSLELTPHGRAQGRRALTREKGEVPLFAAAINPSQQIRIVERKADEDAKPVQCALHYAALPSVLDRKARIIGLSQDDWIGGMPRA
jgi:hypothetical protein